MYIVGGFDGTRLNDLYNIALPMNNDDEFEMGQSLQKHKKDFGSSISGIVHTEHVSLYFLTL